LCDKKGGQGKTALKEYSQDLIHLLCKVTFVYMVLFIVFIVMNVIIDQYRIGRGINHKSPGIGKNLIPSSVGVAALFTAIPTSFWEIVLPIAEAIAFS